MKAFGVGLVATVIEVQNLALYPSAVSVIVPRAAGVGGNVPS